MSDNEWTTEWPTEIGTYWFYSYRYGKGDSYPDNKPELSLMKVPELLLMTVFEISNGLMYIADGQFVFESEVEEPHFQKAILPKTPILK